MALNISQGCYCCARPPSCKMDIDAALDELGMLSTVTESRKQYMQERMRTRSESALMSKLTLNHTTRSLPSSACSSSYQIVHIDTKYVTGFTDTIGGNSDTTTTEARPEVSEPATDDVVLDPAKSYRSPSTDTQELTSDRRRLRSRLCNMSSRNRRQLARKRIKQPYEVPWRLTQSFQESDLLSHRGEHSESKSNSSSPVKAGSGDSLPRSRSLDNLGFSSFFINDIGEKPDIDKVASGLKNLHVTDT